MKGFAVVLCLAICSCATGVRLGDRAGANVNPIRKVVTMLQNMQAKVTAEGEKAKELFDKYMCYCKTSDATLGESIASAENKIPQLESEIEQGTALKAQLEAEVKQAQSDRAEAKETIAKATAMREKQAKEFAGVSGDLKSNIGALSKAIPAIEKGMAGGFLQTSVASVLRRLSVSMEMAPGDRDTLTSFLSQDSSYVPQSGEIVGILKQLKDEMEKDLADATDEENTSIANFKDLVAAKTKEIDSLTKAIETKSQRSGELGVKLAEMANDLEDTKEALGEDQMFLANLEKNCKTKEAEMDEYQKVMAQELVALADVIKVLNDDDALELFKKTLPSAASSFVQVKASEKSVKEHALKALRSSKKVSDVHDTRLDLVEIALHGGKIGFEKIIKMIDDLVEVLKKEQKDDDSKKDYCDAEFDKSDDKKKALEHDISDTEKVIDDAEQTIATLKSDLEALEDSIKALDKNVAEQTEQRKEEHEDYVETLAANNAAKEILAFAKNRLNKFYNPKLYVPPPKRELSEEDQIVVNMGGTLAPTAAPGGIAGTGISASLAQAEVAPPPPPEADLAYKKKGEESSGVIAMIDLIVGDLDKEITEMEVTEKNAQEEYEEFMKDAADERALSSKAITDKTAAKAAAEEELETNKEALSSAKTGLMETMKYIAGLHSECDWLLKYFDTRKAARAGEIESLGKAKDVLAGADYSLLQTS